jgi:hypothetical protein
MNGFIGTEVVPCYKAFQDRDPNEFSAACKARRDFSPFSARLNSLLKKACFQAKYAKTYLSG